ncbi:hypothetical protein GCM10010174_14340 [Kutzneria viridogrisea]
MPSVAPTDKVTRGNRPMLRLSELCSTSAAMVDTGLRRSRAEDLLAGSNFGPDVTDMTGDGTVTRCVL